MENEKVKKSNKGIIYDDQGNPPLLSEEIFWGENEWDGKSGGSVLDLGNDSYVLCFTGPRGACKTSYMTYIAEKCVYLYGKRIVSNFPIKFGIGYKNGEIKHFESENLDIGKMLTFDEGLEDCIVVIDEAPQIINRLATMTWKNRLLTLWIQQLRKNYMSLLYASQNERWVDQELQWQTDLIAYCRDASRRYPKENYKRGSMALIDLIDRSGLWTGFSYDEYPRVFKRRVLTELIWGTFDSNYKFDVFESLRGVSMNLQKYEISQGQQGLGIDMEQLSHVVTEAVNKGKIKSKEFYSYLGELNQKQKQAISRALAAAGIKRTGREYSQYDFSEFDQNKFMFNLEGNQ